jgi:hypothetical protein
MQRKIFWTVFMLLGLLADFLLPFWWACAATIPILFAAWWIAYCSDWFKAAKDQWPGFIKENQTRGVHEFAAV